MTTPEPKLRPVWIPPDLPFEDLPREIQLAAVEIVEPIYRALVLEKTDSLERSAGLTLAHLVWIELVGQTALGQKMAEAVATTGRPSFPPKALARHLRLIGLKSNVTYLLFQIKAFRAKYPLLWGADKVVSLI